MHERSGEARTARRVATAHAVFTGLVLLAAWTAASPSAAAPAVEQKSVLLLLPGQAGLPASGAIAAGVRAPLVSTWPTGISIETEHVDVARFRESEYARGLRGLYRVKYGGRPFDMIIAAGGEPLAFLLRWRGDLWPGTPVIACAVDERTLGAFALPPGVTAIAIRYDWEGTLRAALGLLPATRHVALVGGASPQDRSAHELARTAVRAFGDRLDLIDLTGLPIEDLTERLSRLPEDTVVMGSSFQVDGAGRRLDGSEISESISAASNRPLFDIFETVLGRGIVGGSLVEFEGVGREAGQLAMRALRGEPMPISPVRSAASSALLFDGRQLRRWGLDEARLPAGSRVINHQFTLWEEYRWRVIGAVALVVAQALLIAGLLLERRRRRQVQSGLAELLRFEALAAEISATFAGLPAALVDDHIRDCLHRIAVFLGVDRGTLWQRSAADQALVPTHSWVAGDSVVLSASIAVAEFPLVSETGEKGQIASFARLDDLPPAAALERRIFERMGVRSFAAIPLQGAKNALGVLAFASLRRERSWPSEVMQRIQTLGEHFASALMRKEAATALESSEALTSAVLAALPGETAVVDADGVLVQVNEAWSAVARAGGADFLAAMSAGANYLETCARAVAIPAERAGQAVELLESVLRGERDEAVLEYSCAREGEERWLEMRVRGLRRSGGGAAIMHHDVTARKRAEAAAQRQLTDIAHMDRVAAMAELASSLAHELNQPLAAILANAQAAQRFLATGAPDVDELRACLDDLISDDRRAGEVIRQMRRLLKKEVFSLRPVDVNHLVENAVGLVRNEALLHYVSIELARRPALPAVKADPVQIEQVILNLLSNGIAAAAAGSPAERRVSVSTAVVDGQVELAVRDSGKGIGESDLDRVFEPFFTTKSEGLGMGLAISRSIVEAHGGRIWAENDPAGGATFRLRLPIEGPPPS